MDFASSFADNSGKTLELESPRRIAVHVNLSGTLAGKFNYLQLNQQAASFRVVQNWL